MSDAAVASTADAPYTHAAARAAVEEFYLYSYARLESYVGHRFPRLAAADQVQDLFVKALDALDAIPAEDVEALRAAAWV
jgi:DNA-directed RNA polymerase specialized sigma24 family protein